jgi:hypothetical protein
MVYITVRWQERLVFVKTTLVNAHPGKLAKFVEVLNGFRKPDYARVFLPLYFKEH